MHIATQWREDNGISDIENRVSQSNLLSCYKKISGMQLKQNFRKIYGLKPLNYKIKMFQNLWT